MTTTALTDDLWIMDFKRFGTRNDILNLVKNLRKEDILEMNASYNKEMSTKEQFELITQTCNSSTKVFSVYRDKAPSDPILFCGVSPYEQSPTIGTVWLIGSSEMKTIKKTFVQNSKEWLSILEEGFDGVWCCSYIENTLHHLWLDWLSFSRGDVIEVHPDKKFIPFTRMKLPEVGLLPT